MSTPLLNFFSLFAFSFSAVKYCVDLSLFLARELALLHHLLSRSLLSVEVERQSTRVIITEILGKLKEREIAHRLFSIKVSNIPLGNRVVRETSRVDRGKFDFFLSHIMVLTFRKVV